ncbi:MAG TPA: GntR family transcriptional regulator [Bacillota bacterium]|nr:GntR family transcriptional regulator [Bacillota bacterium]
MSSVPEIDKNNPIPLYYQIKEYFKKQISLGQLKPGDRLHTENWYENYFGVSRVTIRKALEELANESVIVRSRKSGAVIAEPKINRPLNRLTSFQESMNSEGLDTRSKVIEYRIAEIPEDYKEIFNNEKDEKFYFINRLRLVDDKPFAIQQLYLREKYCPNLNIKSLEKKSLYDIVENEYGHTIDHGDQTIDVVTATRQQSQLLSIEPKTPLMHITRTAYLSNGDAFEYTNLLYLSDKYKFSMTLYR